MQASGDTGRGLRRTVRYQNHANTPAHPLADMDVGTAYCQCRVLN